MRVERGTDEPVIAEPDIEELTPDDLDEVARIHAAAFPGAVLTELGHGTLHRYYAWLTRGPHDAQRIGAFRDGELVGYCFGGTFYGSLSGFLRSHPARLALQLAVRPRAIAALARRAEPAALWKVGLRALRFRVPAGEARAHVAVDPATASFGILAIAVDPRAQGGGVGAALMRVAEAEAIRRGFPAMHLSVHPENAGAVAFYERLGWVRSGEPWKGRMTKSIG